MGLRVAYLAEGKLFLYRPGEKPALIESQYAQEMVDAQTAAVGMWAPDACPPSTAPASTTPAATTPASATPAAVQYANCDEVRAANAAPIRTGEPGYSTELDADGDGIACDV